MHRSLSPELRVEGTPEPLLHIPFRGRDWSMNVPVYAEESLNEAVMQAAARLLALLAYADARAPRAQPRWQHLPEPRCASRRHRGRR